MRAFTALYRALDESTATSDKVYALERYFRAAPAADAAWALHVLLGNRPKRMVSSATLRQCAADVAGVAPWLFDACHAQVGDVAETVALLVGRTHEPLSAATPGPSPQVEGTLQYWIEDRLLPLRDLEESAQCTALRQTWSELDVPECLVWNKLLTGAFRVGVAAGLVTRAVALASGVHEQVIAHRLMGRWIPAEESWRRLIDPGSTDTDVSRPYPFALATALDQPPAELGDREEWLAEWKWDGIRAQLVRRQDVTWLWSRGEDLLAGRFPEIEVVATNLPDGTVLDGEILAWQPGTELPMPFAKLQRRIQRKTVSRTILASIPVVFVAYDLLEENGVDVRGLPFVARRALLGELIARTGDVFRLSPVVAGDTWDHLVAARARAREMGAEGIMIKRVDGAYLGGRKRGGWWKWKIDPLTVDAVLIAAQGGSGRRAGLFTDYTFGIWHGGALVPFAKAYSGLTDRELHQVDAFIRRNTLERFGPVRTVKPELVFEIAFEGIQESKRHKSGVAVRFPRIARWRTDKVARDADTIDTARALLAADG
jgi:DNA ligase-1